MDVRYGLNLTHLTFNLSQIHTALAGSANLFIGLCETRIARMGKKGFRGADSESIGKMLDVSAKSSPPHVYGHLADQPCSVSHQNEIKHGRHWSTYSVSARYSRLVQRHGETRETLLYSIINTGKEAIGKYIQRHEPEHKEFLTQEKYQYTRDVEKKLLL